MSRPVKRSFAIKGHRTSISLEAPFWDALKDAAIEQRSNVSAIVARIDATRGKTGLSSAVRIWLLRISARNGKVRAGASRTTKSCS